jgi:hypothetical protein
MRATACCAGVSVWHGPVHEHFTAQRDEPCTSQEFWLEQAERHDPRRAVGAQAAECPVRPPRARCRGLRVRSSACPLVPVSTPACARTHRRTAERIPSPHVAVSTPAAAPAVAQRRGVLGIVRSTLMEGVCALRHGWSTFRRPGMKRAHVQHPLRVPVSSTLSDEDPCGHCVVCGCECVARTGA